MKSFVVNVLQIVGQRDRGNARVGREGLGINPNHRVFLAVNFYFRQNRNVALSLLAILHPCRSVGAESIVDVVNFMSLSVSCRSDEEAKQQGSHQ